VRDEFVKDAASGGSTWKWVKEVFHDISQAEASDYPLAGPYYT